MYLISGVGLAIALFAVSCAVTIGISVAHKDKVQTASPSHPQGMNNLSAEEINRRTLQLAATVKTSSK
jgi:hypothetical protein